VKGLSLVNLKIATTIAAIIIAIAIAYIVAVPSMQDSQINIPESSINKQISSSPQVQSVSLDEENPIKIGLLHSLSGTMAISELSIVDAELLAIDEINERGGVLGRKLVPIVEDGRSDWPTFATKAEKLIVEDEVSAVFGGWTSASRKTMKPIFEEYNHLLFYPVQYEGLEQSPNIIYTGATPNQQILPAIDWAFENLGTRFFLVGSDYVFPKAANEIMKEQIHEIGGQVLGEEYRLLGDTNFSEIVDKIIETKPSIIVNTINGDSNVYFFKELRSRGITPQNIPTISFSIAEDEIRHLHAKDLAGDYSAWNYFQSIDIPTNSIFVENFKKRFGPHRVTDDPIEAGYTSVYLFAKAVEEAGTDDVNAVREKVKGMTFSAPSGIVRVDPDTQHLSKVVRVGQILENGQFKIVSSSEEPIHPIPYPKYKSVDEWNAFLDDLYYGWNENWANPGK